MQTAARSGVGVFSPTAPPTSAAAGQGFERPQSPTAPPTSAAAGQGFERPQSPTAPPTSAAAGQGFERPQSPTAPPTSAAAGQGFERPQSPTAPPTSAAAGQGFERPQSPTAPPTSAAAGQGFERPQSPTAPPTSAAAGQGFERPQSPRRPYLPLGSPAPLTHWRIQFHWRPAPSRPPQHLHLRTPSPAALALHTPQPHGPADERCCRTGLREAAEPAPPVPATRFACAADALAYPVSLAAGAFPPSSTPAPAHPITCGSGAAHAPAPRPRRRALLQYRASRGRRGVEAGGGGEAGGGKAALPAPPVPATRFACAADALAYPVSLAAGAFPPSSTPAPAHPITCGSGAAHAPAPRPRRRALLQYRASRGRRGSPAPLTHWRIQFHWRPAPSRPPQHLHLRTPSPAALALHTPQPHGPADERCCSTGLREAAEPAPPVPATRFACAADALAYPVSLAAGAFPPSSTPAPAHPITCGSGAAHAPAPRPRRRALLQDRASRGRRGSPAPLTHWRIQFHWRPAPSRPPQHLHLRTPSPAALALHTPQPHGPADERCCRTGLREAAEPAPPVPATRFACAADALAYPVSLAAGAFPPSSTPAPAHPITCGSGAAHAPAPRPRRRALLQDRASRGRRGLRIRWSVHVSWPQRLHHPTFSPRRPYLPLGSPAPLTHWRIQFHWRPAPSRPPQHLHLRTPSPAALALRRAAARRRGHAGGAACPACRASRRSSLA
ncbi:hypothetical protein CHLRE_02g141066v5 [Chlamydomonas reinhardtii]|uniref:Uncharacterized protein n=1 Tax=Chlamydomonas reinhardtii TaxID=3055 RepID=A0A2K3E447_CHLRE|nr:uncharacterized protein CHLRE_02g141066v5 [Chlamydomonas reinhardtii]PNW87578.1 hypothetical protein CHLRE_02g141066v5 [Chlamydomonas reinhardtii]